MNWKIIFQLSLFGLIMALGTISLIPQKIEPVFWIVIFILSAWVIAKACNSKYFLHGFLVSMVNSVWITAAHLFFIRSYMASHPDMAAMSDKMPPYLAVHPRFTMVVIGLVSGVLSGIVLGLFSFVASRIVKKSS